MKKNFALIIMVFVASAIISSCLHKRHHDICIAINESEEEYKFCATFDERKTREVQNYIEQYAAANLVVNPSKSQFEGDISIDDNASVNVKTNEGCLKIKFNKEENTQYAYERVKDMCEGIKELLADNSLK